MASISPLLAKWLKVPYRPVSSLFDWDDTNAWGGWLARPQQILSREESGTRLPEVWEEVFENQLEKWRGIGVFQKLDCPPTLSHGLLPHSTWAFPYQVPWGETQGARERLMLVCLPPGAIPQDRMALGLWYPDTIMLRETWAPDSTVLVSGQAIRLDPLQVEDLAWGAVREGEGWIGMSMDLIERSTAGTPKRRPFGDKAKPKS